MSEINKTATVTLNVNGDQATQMMSDLRSKIKDTETHISSLKAKMADPKEIEKAKKQLKTYQKQLAEMESAIEGVRKAFDNLDHATPRQLEKALRTLNRQLKDMTPGSAVWDSHVAKIKELKTRLAELHGAVAKQESLWARFKNWATGAWPAIDLITGWGSRLSDVMRGAVDAYAEMDQELANTRKFTGMTAEQVADLNEDLKKMDTRTSREGLNQLAQEAGRLGKKSKEEILGFVRAADQINVALDDIGEGATLTLSKLTGIFGDEQRYGTEQSLLKVGSVINELSQNCAASSSYLTQFTSRMGGVGAQAKMTIPQIMAFGAVLDSNGQAVEASSTALSQVIVRMMQQPAKYAKVAGLDVKKFTDMLKTDVNGALILFLETLQKAGGMDTLSPMFKDMGENGSRAIAALSTLATHIDQVKAQQIEANKAFEEGTSVTNEFNVQNTTVPAALDKAKKAVNELRVELGEHLYPLMAHLITSGSAMIKALITTIHFVSEHKAAVVSLVAVIGTYNAIMLVYNTRTKMAAVATAIFNNALKIVKGVIPALRVLITPLINAIQYFTNGLEVNYAMQQRWRKSMEAMKFSSWVGLILSVAGAVYALTSRFNEATKAAEQARKEAEEFKKKITDIDEASADYCAKEVDRLESLYKAANDQSKSTDERRKAAERLQELYPAYFKNLSTEEIMVGNAKTAYDQLRDSIIEVARARAAAAKIEENEKELLTLELQAPTLKAQRDKDKATHDAAVSEWSRARELESNQSYANSTDAAVGQMVDVAPYTRKVASTGKTYNASEAAYQANLTKQRQLNEANQFLRDKYNISANALVDPDFTETNFTGGGTGGSGGSSSAHSDKFAKEKEWREQAEASARISYATGETDYIAYTRKMDEITVDFYEKQLMHTDLSETERLQITAQWREAQVKLAESDAARSLDIENNSYNERMAELKQFYIDGKVSKETYDSKVEELEIEHQRNIVAANKEATKDRENAEIEGYEQRKATLETQYQQGIINETDYKTKLEELERVHIANIAAIRKGQLEAEKQLQNLLLQQTQRRQQETEKQEAKYAAMKKDYFGDNPLEAQNKLDDDLAMLQMVYDREIAAAGNNATEKLRIEEAFEKAKLALKKKYGLLSEEDTRNAMEKGIADSVEWLNSDGGKAVTGSLDTLVSGMSAVFSQLSSLMQADLEIQTAKIEKRYNREVELAQGNSYKVAMLEKKKEAEIAKVKNDANKKMFAMQVIQAVAQTAQNALSAYGSAAAIPVVGHILAPIAAAMAVSAGAIQIATIKKQQQASEVQGYSGGGFTKPGRVDEPAGVVHAGEWVASQKLLANPIARPMINALDYAQRTNTIGSLRPDDVSRSLTANNSLVRIAEGDGGSALMVAAAVKMSRTVDSLTRRLDEPFVTINTVTGDHGIKQAQDEYSRLINNVTPKSKRKK